MLPAPPFPPPPPPGTDAFAAAVAAFQAGAFAEADRLAAGVPPGHPHATDALNMRGILAAQAGRPAEAVGFYQRAVALAPGVAALHHNLGGALRTLGRHEEALAAFRRAVALAPSPGSLTNLGNTLLALGRAAEAEAPLRRAAAQLPGQPDVHHNLGCALLAAHRTPEAAEAFARALTLRPGFVPAAENLCRARLALGDAAGALTLATQTLTQADTPALRAAFVAAVLAAPAAVLPRAPLLRALREGWGRPLDLAPAVSAQIPPADWPVLAADPLLAALLERAPVAAPALEAALCRARRDLLALASTGAPDPEALAFALALARQCHVNEHAWPVPADEQARADALIAGLGAPPAPLALAVAACYAPLASLPGAVALRAADLPAAFAPLLRAALEEPARERALAAALPTLTPLTGDVSAAVAAQYEENPYPRWIAPSAAPPALPVGEWLHRRFPAARLAPIPHAGAPRVLIAGCGTGLHAQEARQRFAGAQVLGVDLSRASLAYARRMTAALGIDAIAFAQADLLALPATGRRFDVIESVGVLHHMAEPFAGWRALCAMLEPGGIMQIGLYSARARRDIATARAVLAGLDLPPGLPGIRACRAWILGHPDEPWVARILASPDFYAASPCRDLLLHVHEHQHNLPEIAAFLAEQHLTLLGLETDPDTEQAYRTRFPDDPALTNLTNWDALEAALPDTFAGMFRLWVQAA